MKTKILTLFLTLSIIVLISCDNDDDSQVTFESSAEILGIDMTLCMCCGGWLINIDGEESIKRFSELPQNSNIDLQNSTFPITVQLNWTETMEHCGNRITIDSIKLVE